MPKDVILQRNGEDIFPVTRYENILNKPERIEGVHVGPTAPENNKSLWIDTGNSSYNYNNPLLLSIQEAVAVLQQKVNLLMNIRFNGAVAGSLDDSAREEMMRAAEAVIPSIIEDSYEESEAFNPNTEEIKPDYKENVEPTVNSISIKIGNWDQLVAHQVDFVQGELMWCKDRKRLYIYMNGQLIPASGASSGGDSTDPDNDMDEETVQLIVDEKLANVTSLGFIPIGSEEPQYTVKVDEYGKLICYDNSKDNRNVEPSGTYVFADTVAATGLLINSFYLGGTGNEHSYQPCSHNYVELANVAKDSKGNPIDVNLNGYYLYYKNKSGIWYSLPLWGTVKSNGTFLIRGAQCSVMDVNTTKIKVKSFDMEWYITENDTEKLISFDTVTGGNINENGVVFYLAWGDEEGRVYDLSGNLTKTPAALVANTNNKVTEVAKGYIDLASIQVTTDGLVEANTYQLPRGVNAKDVLFHRWYAMDPVTQSNPDDGPTEHDNRKFLTCTFLNGANFDDLMDIAELTPKASYEGKTMSATRSMFAEDHPSTLTCTFGVQATYKDAQHPATRCFCWNSVGYYDEFIRYRVKGTSEWTYKESIKNQATANGSTLWEYYQRLRWESSYGQTMTTHKVILPGLSAGIYEYQVWRDDSYTSDVREFTVRSDSSLQNGFVFAQVTDQQGANWEEYEVWNLSARKLAEEAQLNQRHGDFDFLINTGDICYNGSRSNEWIDYFNGYYPLRNKEEMLTIGNNDLAPIKMYEIGTGKESPWKINVNVVDYFYCYEMDEDNPAVFAGLAADESGQVEYRIPSLYSFNYGQYHFLSILSEIRTISNKEETSDSEITSSSTFTSKAMKQSTVNTIFGVKDQLRGDGSNKHASAIYDVEEAWVIRDLMKWKGAATLPSISDISANLTTYRCDNSLVEACGKCIVYIHEMPFNIVSDSSYNNYRAGASVPRETAKAYLNRFHDYEYQRAFKVWGIKLVMGGHKHTAAMTQPVYDAPLAWEPGDAYSELFTLANGETCFSNIASFIPIVQVLKSDWENETYNSYIRPGTNVTTVFNNTSSTVVINGTSVASGDKYTYPDADLYPRARVELVDTITAPSYIMCQATGFKNKSNSDLACSTTNGVIPWENFYVAKNNVGDQCYPFYTIYEVGANGNIAVKMYKITGFYDPGTNEKGSVSGYWDLVNIYNPNLTLEENRQVLVNNSSLERFNTTDTIINTN